MRRVRSLSEDEVFAIWLKGEFEASRRFSRSIGDLLERFGSPHELLTDPNVRDPEENARRRGVLKELRGLGTDDNLLAGFPTDVRWALVAFEPRELEAILYIDWDYWLKLSGGSRRPVDAVAGIRSGATIYGVSNDGFLEIAAGVREGMSFPPIIAVTDGTPGSRVVVIEGHSRLTAFMLASDALPAETEVILGTSSRFAEWWAY